MAQQQDSAHLVVTTTTDSETEATRLASSVVDAHLGACVQVIGPITSVYRWENAVQTDPEWRLEIKTAADRLPALIEHLNTEHTYDVPEIIATPITGGTDAYLDWLVDETRPRP